MGLPMHYDWANIRKFMEVSYVSIKSVKPNKSNPRVIRMRSSRN